MDVSGFEDLKVVLDRMGYEAEPVPVPGEEIRYLDITSDGARIPPAHVMNAITQAGAESPSLRTLRLVASQQFRITVEDIGI